MADVRAGAASPWKLASAGTSQCIALMHEAGCIRVIDQWSSSGTIQKRCLRFDGRDKAGKYKNPSNNGGAFSAIE